jgi:hypothetical protein
VRSGKRENDSVRAEEIEFDGDLFIADDQIGHAQIVKLELRVPSVDQVAIEYLFNTFVFFDDLRDAVVLLEHLDQRVGRQRQLAREHLADLHETFTLVVEHKPHDDRHDPSDPGRVDLKCEHEVGLTRRDASSALAAFAYVRTQTPPQPTTGKCSAATSAERPNARHSHTGMADCDRRYPDPAAKRHRHRRAIPNGLDRLDQSWWRSWHARFKRRLRL